MRGARGATLIELVVTIAITAIALLGLMLVVSGVVSHSADPMVEQQAEAIAEAYMEEIMLADFCDPDALAAGQTCRQQCTSPACTSATCGGGAGFVEAGRSQYDNVCDYAGIDDSGARDRNGDPLPGLGDYRVRVAVTDNDLSFGSPAIAADSGAMVRVEVNVTHPAFNHAIRLRAVRANAQ